MPKDGDDALTRARKKAYVRLIPLVFVSYMIAYIDRSNVALAKLTMAKDLGFDDRIYSIGAGIFFVGYFLLEIPGALIVERWSARKWISRIMVTWGIIAAATALVKTEGQFYTARFLLGLAEAGFFPGVIVYLTHWFPRHDRARALALFFIAAPIAGLVSPILSYPLLRIGTTQVVDGLSVSYPLVWGMTGWQWLFIAWGLPAVMLGFFVLYAMTDRPRQARWLSEAEKAALEAELERERAEALDQRSHANLIKVLLDPRVLVLAAANFLIVCGHYGVEFFLPTFLTDWYHLSLSDVAWLVLIPSGAILLGQLAVSWSSDRTGERWWHTSLPMFAGGLALLLTPASQGHLVLTMLCFAVASIGIRSYLPPFYALPKLFLHGSAAAGAIGLINAVGNLGGTVGPIALGQIQSRTGSFHGGIFFLAGTSTLAGLLIVGLRAWYRRAHG